MFCPRCSVPDVLSQMSCSKCSVPNVLSPMSCPKFPVPAACPATLSTVLLMLLSCRCCQVLVDPIPHSRLNCWGWPIWPTCLDWPPRLSSPSDFVPDILSQLPYHGYPILVVLSLLSWSGHPVICFLSWLHYPDCLRWPSSPGCPVPAFRSWLSCPSFLPRLTCLSCPTIALLSPAHLSLLSCPCCHVLALLSSLSCQGWPVRPTCPNRPVQVVLCHVTSVVMFQMSCPNYAVRNVL